MMNNENAIAVKCGVAPRRLVEKSARNQSFRAVYLHERSQASSDARIDAAPS
jgi:hypothetical protein